MAIGVLSDGVVPKGLEWDTRDEEVGENISVGDGDSGDEEFGGELRALVGEDAEVEAEDRELGEGEGGDVEDGAE